MSESIQVRMWKASAVPTEWLERRGAIGGEDSRELEVYVKSIIDEVKDRGNSALTEFVKRFDNVDLTPKDFEVTREEIENAYDSVSGEQITALEFMKDKVQTFERQILKRMSFTVEGQIKIHSVTRPIQDVGCYVPGGEAAYPSTMIMTTVPAKVAGVPRVAVCTPPAGEGVINPLTLVAADLCGIDEIYKIGGAHAIATLAYGTETIKPVGKIVGPGNKYVTMGKLLVSRVVAIDIPAGESEVLVLADESADPAIIALDMISQAEHPGVAGLVTTSKDLAKSVVEELRKITPSLRRREIITESLSRYSFIIICDNMREAIHFTNRFAPEHLEVMTEKPVEVVEKITSAGLILLGTYTPVSASDYCVGTNHVLPTSGFGRVSSGLSVLDFVKRINCVEGSKRGLYELRDKVRVLAEAEDLPNHFLAVEGRFKP